MTSITGSGWAQTQTTQNTSTWIMTPDSNNNTDMNKSLGEVPTDCVVLGLNATILWDNPHNILSQQAWRVLEQLRSGLFFPVMFFVGVPSNIVNMAVFRKQGLKDRINMCLFALALADLLNITFWFCSHAERIYTAFSDDQILVPSIRFLFKINVIGLIGLMYAPPFLNTVISVERCVCVLFPLHARRCMSTKTLAAIIFVALSFLVGFEFAVTAKLKSKCLHVMRTGETVWMTVQKLQEDVQLNIAMVNSINGILYGFIISMGCPLVVFLTTTITAIKLSQIVRWRRQASSSATSSSSSSSAAVSSKEVGLTKMLMCLSLEFFVLSIPMLLQKIWPLFNDDMRYGKPLHNTSYFLSILNQICVCTSSSVNFFVYYCTGTKFRHTLHAMMKMKSSTDKTSMATSTSVSSTAAWVQRSETGL